MELASRADQRVLRWFGHVERMYDYRMAINTGVDGRSRWGTDTRETEVRLDGWCAGGGCTTMLERPERVESPGTNVIE